MKQVLDPRDDDLYGEPGFSEDDVDTKLSPRNSYNVMDADPSQIAVIEDLKAGRNLVVEGPPGTGKSQTITNIIAELLAAGKQVLFVSEKMAALEVVKNRLDKVGVGPYCLELHSRKARKKEVLRELERTTNLRPPKRIHLEEDFSTLEKLRDDLNDYAAALRLPVGQTGYCPYDLFALHEESRQHFLKAERDCPRLKLKEPVDRERHVYTEAISKLEQLADIFPLVRPVTSHPWLGCNPGVVLPSDQRDIAELIERAIKLLTSLRRAIDELVQVSGVRDPATIKDLRTAIKAARIIAASKPTDRAVLLDEAWNKPRVEATELIGKLKKCQELDGELAEQFQEGAFEANVEELLDEFRALSARFFRFLSPRYRYLKREITSMYRVAGSRSLVKISDDLRSLKCSKTLHSELKELATTGRSMFGAHWKGPTGDPLALTRFCEWITSFRRMWLSNLMSESAIELVVSGNSRGDVATAIARVQECFEKYAAAHKQVSKRIGLTDREAFGKTAQELSLSELGAKLERWLSNVAKLPNWTQFLQCCREAKQTLGAGIVGILKGTDPDPSDIIPCFKSNLADGLLRVAFEQRPVLSKFVGEMHNNKRSRFAELDRQLILSNRQRLACALYDARPGLSHGASSGSEAGILLGEFGRKRGHIPIRKLLSLAGNLIQKIKPCFMMSPLSIAQFLDPRATRFDVVIFDEASQVKPEDALGALLRGSQVAVLGDTRQLPPTSFFEHIVEAEEEEQIASIADVESILHQCKRAFPTKHLRWHYRSRHESLIAVSNQEFYDNNLCIYPSSIHEDDYLGLHFTHLPETVYDRGRSGGNRLEARAVARAAVEHYRRYPDKSLGIGAFNTKQQQVILEEVELILRQQPEMQDLFASGRDEHFFVKNLETIQGDERDVIFISVGFGFDATRKFSRNFGPLNQEGGERRLNVLITRAREASVVFSNFSSSDLMVDARSPFGVRSLKVFLQYAQNRDLISVTETGRDFDSPFEEAVYEFLRSNGYEVHKQVGCASYRVDLAIVDVEQRGRYLLGIECDGARYHSSQVARERDRLREQILCNLGWQLHRIWSTDWYLNRLDTQARLLDAIKTARTNSMDHAPRHPTPRDSEQAAAVEYSDEGEPLSKVVDPGTSVVSYERLTSTSVKLKAELLDTPASTIAKVVQEVVNTEGPIAFDELVTRVRSLWKLGRAGNRIREAILDAVALAIHQGQIRGDDHDFLWSENSGGGVTVRRRGTGDPRGVHTICSEEIAEAARIVLRIQHATLPDDLMRQTAKLFGFKAVGRIVGERIEAVLEQVELDGEIVRRTNGMLDLRQDGDNPLDA